MYHSWLVEDWLQVGFEALQVSEMQSQIRTEMAEGLASGMVAKLGVVMLCVKQPTTARRKDQWGAVEVLEPAVFGVKWVAQVYSIATRG